MVDTAFMWIFASAVIAGAILAARIVFKKTPNLNKGIRWIISFLSLLPVLIVGGIMWLFGCLAMNFIGQ